MHQDNDSDLTKAKAIIDNEDLSPVVNRLIQIEHWRPREAHEAVKQYRNYLYLRRKYPDQELPPSKDIDEAWHAHVLHTKAYRDFCKRAFPHESDQYLDHHPHLAKEGTMVKLEKLFARTQALHHKEFGDYIYQITGKNVFTRMLDRLRDVLVARFPQLSDS